MSKLIEYVGVFHTLRDRVREVWTQYWTSREESSGAEVRSDGGGCGGGVNDAGDRESNFRIKVKERLERLKHQTIRRIDRSSSLDEDYSHLTRPKTRRELLRISAAVMGIEFSYAAETAFVSPLLLNLGLRHRHMTLMWSLSPLVGFFVTPILGSMSDGCRSPLGRRRPFILLLSIGIILGLLLVPNGKLIGRLLGDTYKEDSRASRTPAKVSVPIPTAVLKRGGNFDTGSPLNLTDWSTPYKEAYFSKYRGGIESQGFRSRNNIEDEDTEEFVKSLRLRDKNSDTKLKLTQDDFNKLLGQQQDEEIEIRNKKNFNLDSNDDDGGGGGGGASIKKNVDEKLIEEQEEQEEHEDENSVFKNHPFGLVFTVLGTILLDFDADACQSPSRAYMLDVTIPEDHARGLSTFTVMAGLGGSLGYFMGALNWENTFIGDFFGGQVRAVFTLVLFIFIACVIITIRSFREIPIDRLWSEQRSGIGGRGGGGFAPGPPPIESIKGGITSSYSRFEDSSPTDDNKTYGSTRNVHETSFNGQNTHAKETTRIEMSEEIPTFREYVKTIIQLPKSLQWLCLTNFFCWMSLVCYSLYFTDFVGETVFNGDPTAPLGSNSRKNYDDGVRFGCWGMSLYSLSCSIYSLAIETLVSRFGTKRVYITGQLVYSVGMVLMALFRNQFGVLFFSWTAGIMYATLFTMPYLLVARYHAAETFDVDIDDLVSKPTQMRGLGTDVAIVSSMVFLAQITQALTLGSIVAAVGSTTAIVCAASVFALCGALSATKVLYLDI